jgi:hypothetical protein
VTFCASAAPDENASAASTIASRRNVVVMKSSLARSGPLELRAAFERRIRRRPAAA